MDAPHPGAIPGKIGAVPGKLGKAVKGHKPIVYVGALALAVVIAYYVRRRENANAAVPTAQDATTVASPDPSQQSGYGSYGGAATYDGTQGAYYGYSDPTLGGQLPSNGFTVDDLTGIITALGYGQQYAPMPVPTPTPDYTPAPADHPPTGGGPPDRPHPVVIKRPPPAATFTPAAPATAIHDHGAPPNPSFPFKSTRGWYRVEVNPRGHKPGRYHFYAPPPLGDGSAQRVG